MGDGKLAFVLFQKDLPAEGGIFGKLIKLKDQLHKVF
jgi:hypothetical protein